VFCGEAKAAAGAPVSGEDAGDDTDGAKFTAVTVDGGDDIDGEEVTDVEVERGGAPEMAPPGGEDLGAGGILGGEERDDLTQNGVGEEADSVDPIFFFCSGSRRRILDEGYVSAGSRRTGIRCARRWQRRDVCFSLLFRALGCLRLPSLGTARRRRQVGLIGGRRKGKHDGWLKLLGFWVESVDFWPLGACSFHPHS